MHAGQPLGDDQLELLFLGTGTSAGVPMIACHCETCTSTDPHDKRTRPSVVISYRVPSSVERPASRDATRRESDDRATRGVAATDVSRENRVVSVLIDTTPELRLQCIANRVDSIDAIVFTHAHADHIMGLDDVRRFNAVCGGPLDVYA